MNILTLLANEIAPPVKATCDWIQVRDIPRFKKTT